MQFHPEVPAIWMNRATLRAVLPREEPLAYLRGKIRCRGREICPVPVAVHPDLAMALHLEADLDAWHVPPFAGPSSEWPREVVRVLRHIRTVRGMIQQRNWTKDEEDRDAQA